VKYSKLSHDPIEQDCLVAMVPHVDFVGRWLIRDNEPHSEVLLSRVFVWQGGAGRLGYLRLSTNGKCYGSICSSSK
jgi:hypothetical protein